MHVFFEWNLEFLPYFCVGYDLESMNYDFFLKVCIHPFLFLKSDMIVKLKAPSSRYPPIPKYNFLCLPIYNRIIHTMY